MSDAIDHLHDEQAERCLLGAIMLWPTECGDALARLQPADCYVPRHAAILDALQRLTERGDPIDVTTAWTELGAMRKQQTVGGLQTLADLTDLVASSTSATKHLARVVDLSRKRKLVRVLQQATAEVVTGTRPFREMADIALRGLMDATATADDKDAQKLGDLCDRVFEDMSNPASRKVRYRTGIATIDEVLAPMEGGQLIVTGARPSVGKTSLVLSVALHVAREGGTVLFFSLETTDVRIARRAMATASGVRLARLAGHEGLEEGDLQQALAGAQSLFRLPVWIDDAFDATIPRIAAKARRHKARHGLALVVIDYLQLIETAAGNNRNREQEIASVSRGLKKLAKELDVPVIALSQLNRESEKRPDKKPSNADLRESGQLEQDADAILLLWRDEAKPAELQVCVSKQKDGPTGDAVVVFDRATTSFRTGAESYQQRTAGAAVVQPDDDEFPAYVHGSEGFDAAE